MNPIRPLKSLYLDTNAFIYANFYLSRPSLAPNLEYYSHGEHVVNALKICKERNVRVFSTDLAYLEMHHNYYEWARLKQALHLDAPLGLLFGKGRRMDQGFLNQPLNIDAQQQVLDATVNWLKAWDFHELVEFKEPEEIPNWFQIAKYIYTQYMETVLDCLHLAAAIGLECDYFLTQDGELRKLIAEMRGSTTFKQALWDNFGLSDDYELPDAVKAQSFALPT